ncbi:MAG: hypothetical protein WA419_10170 [Silvibacterium sp.]
MLEIDVLPDFPKSKNELLRQVSRRIASLEKEQHPILAQIKTFTQHEGVTIQFEQVDYGKKTQEAEKQAVSVEIRIDEIPTLRGEALDKKMMLLADQAGSEKMKSLFARINEATEQTGQRLDAGGKPLDGRMLLDMMDMAECGFDRSGKPTNSFIVHPDIMPSLKRASEEVENDPELKRQLESINSRQLQQWVDRENRRKLVE